MSDISIGTFGGSTTAAPVASDAIQGLDKDAFLSLLVAQVKYQNPLEPTDSTDMLSQASQYAMVEQLENMSQAQTEMRAMQMVSIATGLVGEDIVAVEPIGGTTVSGVVEGVRFGTEPILIVDGFEVPLSAVISIGESIDLDASAVPTPIPEATAPPPIPPGPDATINSGQPPENVDPVPEPAIDAEQTTAVHPGGTPQDPAAPLAPTADPRLSIPVEAVRDEVRT